MFVVTLNRTRLRQIGVGVMCCAMVVCSALLGRYISNQTVTAAAGTGGKIESAQDIQTWFTGYGIEVDGASISADKVKIPRKWDDSFSAFNEVVAQSGLDLSRLQGQDGGKVAGPDPGGLQRRGNPVRGAAGVQEKAGGGLSAGKALRDGDRAEGCPVGHGPGPGGGGRRHPH